MSRQRVWLLCQLELTTPSPPCDRAFAEAMAKDSFEEADDLRQKKEAVVLIVNADQVRVV